jgi:hypothetical protein
MRALMFCLHGRKGSLSPPELASRLVRMERLNTDCDPDSLWDVILDTEGKVLFLMFTLEHLLNRFSVSADTLMSLFPMQIKKYEEEFVTAVHRMYWVAESPDVYLLKVEAGRPIQTPEFGVELVKELYRTADKYQKFFFG